jgi:hypothetical protein
VRRVKTAGEISWCGQSIRLSSALAGWDIGIRPGTAPGATARGENYEVWFSSLLIGWLAPAAQQFIRSDYLRADEPLPTP